MHLSAASLPGADGQGTEDCANTQEEGDCSEQQDELL
jgi:hypothetical protein